MGCVGFEEEEGLHGVFRRLRCNGHQLIVGTWGFASFGCFLDNQLVLHSRVAGCRFSTVYNFLGLVAWSLLQLLPNTATRKNFGGTLRFDNVIHHISCWVWAGVACVAGIGCCQSCSARLPLFTKVVLLMCM
jgi:hypothetical protein